MPRTTALHGIEFGEHEAEQADETTGEESDDSDR